MNKTKNFKGNFTKKPFPSEIQFELDPYKRPIQKIALLCGSPGAGVSFSFLPVFNILLKSIRKPHWHMLLLNMLDTMSSK